MKDLLIQDFTDIRFQKAFQLYFDELGIFVEDWNSFFEQMNQEQENKAYIRISDTNETVGFVLFQPIVLSHWFFQTQFGFIREFWVAGKYRGEGNGKELLLLAEKYLKNKGIFQIILTTDTSDLFYEKNGYTISKTIAAKNKFTVYIKELKCSE